MQMTSYTYQGQHLFGRYASAPSPGPSSPHQSVTMCHGESSLASIYEDKDPKCRCRDGL
jgi:hypothetical protein